MIYLLVFIVSLIVSCALTPLAKKTALRFNVVDHSGQNPLKIHKAAIPYLGGAAIFGAFVMGLVLFMGLRWKQVGDITVEMYVKFLGILAGASIVFFIGLYDDIKPINPGLRFLGQFIAGVILVFVGLKVNVIPFAVIGIPLTIFYVMGAINALNLLDGLDGLATGVSFIASVGFMAVSLLTGNAVGLVLSVVIMGATLGFLFFNFYPASIFMGDSGSTFLGFILAVMMISLTQRPYNFAGFLAPILILGVPIFDTAFAVIRRAINKKPLFIGDRSHFYDLLMDKFANQRLVCVIVYGISIIFSGLGVLLVLNS